MLLNKLFKFSKFAQKINSEKKKISVIKLQVKQSTLLLDFKNIDSLNRENNNQQQKLV